jgi:cytoskeletal protein CcmA (bactofilin family)
LVGKVERGGDVRVNGSLAGKVESAGDIRKNGSLVGKVEGVPATHAAVIFFWDFFQLER